MIQEEMDAVRRALVAQLHDDAAQLSTDKTNEVWATIDGVDVVLTIALER